MSVKINPENLSVTIPAKTWANFQENPEEAIRYILNKWEEYYVNLGSKNLVVPTWICGQQPRFIDQKKWMDFLLANSILTNEGGIEIPANIWKEIMKLSSNVRGEVLEGLSSLIHDIWAGWQSYVFEKSIKNDDGSVTIPKWAVERWERQIQTPYIKLSENEKEIDRKEAKKIIRFLDL